MSFLSGHFLIALAAAAGPLIIHLLNRRRYRTLHWAAMDFLREAVHRNRRLLRLRDLLLLALRTAVVALFVLAMSRPFWARQGEAGAHSDDPVHAVLLVDNSLSMGHEELGQTLLDQAKTKAAEFIRSLPKNSEVSILPMCESGEGGEQAAYASQEDALEALQRLAVVDRSARAYEASQRALKACQKASAIPDKRVVFLSDMQRQDWPREGLREVLARMADVQIAPLGPAQRTNTWVEEFRSQDGVADADSPAVLRATIRHEGEPRRNVGVALRVDGTEVEARTVDLLGGQHLQLIFRYRFPVAGTSREPLFSVLSLELSPDHTPGDDRRVLVVPVVARVPVLFIDQHGSNERPALNRYGETYPLRRLLAPPTPADGRQKQLVSVLHRRMEEVRQEELAEARLVVIAGAPGPPPDTLRLLREYVEQGGALWVAAGGEFSPRDWSSAAWQDGAGILPAPLRERAIGRLPLPEATDAPVFRLAADSFQDPMLALPLTRPEAEELLLRPFFYKAVAADVAAAEAAQAAESKRLEERRKLIEEHEAAERRWTELERKGQLSAEDSRLREAAREQRARLEPKWLAWSGQSGEELSYLSPDQLAERSRPRVMARYQNGEAFAVRRCIGRGEVVMLTTGVFPQWNSLSVETSVLILDQMLRGLLARSLPDRNYGPVNAVLVPVPPQDQGGTFTVRGPGDQGAKPLAVEALTGNRFGLLVRSPVQRGMYEVARVPEAGEKLDAGWRMALAVNGPPEEGAPAAVERDEFLAGLNLDNVRFLSPGDAIRLEAKSLIAHDFWKWLMVLALAGLVCEMLMLRAGRANGGRP